MEKAEKIASARRQRNNLLIAVVVSALVTVGIICTSGKKEFYHGELHDEEQHQVKVLKLPPAGPSQQELEEKVKLLDQKVRDLKETGVFMEVDKEGVKASRALQDATRKLLEKKYGKFDKNYRVRVDLEFQSTISDFEEKGAHESIVLEMAPISLQPHSVYSFLQIAQHWTSGAFHRRAPHVLQVMVQRPPVKHLAFQEYSPKYPHVKGTVGYAGRPSGPAWYISIQDNSRNHGPGSQQDKNPHEADSCFGKVVEGFDTVVLGRITKMGGAKGMGFINDSKQHVLIKAMHILVPSGNDYVEWKA